MRPQNKDRDLGECSAIAHLMALACPVRALDFIYLLILYSWYCGFNQNCGVLGTYNWENLLKIRWKNTRKAGGSQH